MRSVQCETQRNVDVALYAAVLLYAAILGCMLQCCAVCCNVALYAALLRCMLQCFNIRPCDGYLLQAIPTSAPNSLVVVAY